MIKALKYNMRFQSYKLSPFRNGKVPFMKFYSMIISSIKRLFFPCRPSAIFFKIAFVVVNTFKRILWGRLFLHIIIKTREAIPPFIANSYSASAIIFKFRIIRVITAIKHMIPTSVFRSTAHTMFSKSFFLTFFVDTTTTLGVFSSKVSSLNNFDISTRALTFPAGKATLGIFSSFNHSKAVECFSSKVNKFRHEINLQAKGYKHLVKCGRQLLEDCFSGMTLSTQNNNIAFIRKTQEEYA